MGGSPRSLRALSMTWAFVGRVPSSPTTTVKYFSMPLSPSIFLAPSSRFEVATHRVAQELSLERSLSMLGYRGLL